MKMLLILSTALTLSSSAFAKNFPDADMICTSTPDKLGHRQTVNITVPRAGWSTISFDETGLNQPISFNAKVPSQANDEVNFEFHDKYKRGGTADVYSEEVDGNTRYTFRTTFSTWSEAQWSCN